MQLFVFIAGVNGSTWKTGKLAPPYGLDATGPRAVSCARPASCLAVGETGAGLSLFSNAAFTGFWNGGKWRLVPAS